MKRETIIPRDRAHWLQLRVPNINGTEMASAFKVNPYGTLLELYYRLKNKEVVEIEQTERMKCGTFLESPIAAMLAEKNGWTIRRMNEYMYLPEKRIGASFDYAIGDDAILEIKNVDSLAYRDGWIVDEDGNIEAPPHIEIQFQVQLLVSGRKRGYIGALVGGNRLIEVEREQDLSVHEAIFKNSGDLWAMVDSGTPPEPDFPADAEFIARFMNYAQPNKVMNIGDNYQINSVAEEYRDLGQQIKSLEERRDTAKAKLLMAIGDHEKALGQSFTISAGVVAGAHIEYDRKPYRTFKINWKKVSK